MADAALLEAIPRKPAETASRFAAAFAFRWAVLSGCPFHGEGHRKVWARLRMGGIRTSRRRVLRLMREHDLLAPSRVGSPKGPRNHGGNEVSRRDGTIIPDRVDALWGTDPAQTLRVSP